MTKNWVETTKRLRELATADKPSPCSHLDMIHDVTPSAEGCEECMAMGDRWVHLRMCLVCGHVGCCDHSPNRHATRHFEQTGHPLVQSLEPWEDWVWCYVDQAYLLS